MPIFKACSRIRKRLVALTLLDKMGQASVFDIAHVGALNQWPISGAHPGFLGGGLDPSVEGSSFYRGPGLFPEKF